MREGERQGPWWWPIVVGVAVVLGALWLLWVIIGVLVALVKLAILVVLSIALILWAVNRKRDRRGPRPPSR